MDLYYQKQVNKEASFELAAAARASASGIDAQSLGLPSTTATPRAFAPDGMDVDAMVTFPPAASRVQKQIESSVIASPTAAEMDGWSKILDAALWAGFDSTKAALLSSLLEHMDTDENALLRVFGTTSEEAWREDLQDWMVNGRRARSTHETLAERLIHAARVFACVDKTLVEQLQDDKNQQAMENNIRWCAAQQSSIIQQAPSSSSHEVAPKPPEFQRRIKMCDVADPLRVDLGPTLGMNGVSQCLEHGRPYGYAQIRSFYQNTRF